MNEQHQYFDPLNPKYKCLCGCCHVTTFTKIICWLSIIMSTLNIIPQIIMQPSKFYFALLALALALLIFGTPLYAMKAIKPLWMLPLLILSGFQGLLGIILVIFIPFFYRSPDGGTIFDVKIDINTIVILAILIVTAIIVSSLSCWIFSIYYRCYQYLVEKKNSAILPINDPNTVELYQCQSNQPPLLS